MRAETPPDRDARARELRLEGQRQSAGPAFAVAATVLLASASSLFLVVPAPGRDRGAGTCASRAPSVAAELRGRWLPARRGALEAALQARRQAGRGRADRRRCAPTDSRPQADRSDTTFGAAGPTLAAAELRRGPDGEPDRRGEPARDGPRRVPDTASLTR